MQESTYMLVSIESTGLVDISGIEMQGDESVLPCCLPTQNQAKLLSSCKMINFVIVYLN